MKILLLTPDCPYPSASGAAIRSWGILRGLHAAGHRLSLLCFSEQPQLPADNPLHELCVQLGIVEHPRRSRWQRLWQLLSSQQADLAFRLQSAAYERQLRCMLQRQAYDIVYIVGLELACMLGTIRAQLGPGKVVYDALNAEAELQRLIASVQGGSLRRLPAALYSRIQVGRLQHFERSVCRGVDVVIAVSDEDRRLLQAYAGAPITVMPNGVSAAQYAREPVPRAPAQLLFTGKMDYRPNVDAAEWCSRKILPRVWQQAPETRLSIVGAKPPAQLQGLARDPRIEVTGWVESVLPYLHSASVFVVPLRMGSGTRLKILQAMAAGCAIVSTSIGAAGLNDAARASMVLADEAGAFADAVLALLADDARREALGQAAQAAVRAHYDWDVLIPTLLKVCEQLQHG